MWPSRLTERTFVTRQAHCFAEDMKMGGNQATKGLESEAASAIEIS